MYGGEEKRALQRESRIALNAGALPNPAELDRVQRKLLMRFERWPVRIEMMLPSNTGFAEVEPVFLFHSIHAVNNRVADLRLQFADKAVKGTHLDNRDKTESFQKPALAGDGIERLIENGKATVSPALPFKMMDSQFAPPRASWSGMRQC